MAYPGGKAGAGVYQTIINLMPPHARYFEPFLGAAAVMRRKRPALVNMGIDINPAAPGLAWLAGRSGSAIGVTVDSDVFIAHCSDGIRFLQSHDFEPGDLVYCDPPYLARTRLSKRRYAHDLADVDHRRLLRCIRTLPCMVMISGYASRMYSNALKSWHEVTYEAMTRGGRKATEHLWLNFDPPLELHDYDHLGRDFRERERLRRKKQRWVKRLLAMPDLERRMLRAAIAETARSGEGALLDSQAVELL